MCAQNYKTWSQSEIQSWEKKRRPRLKEPERQSKSGRVLPVGISLSRRCVPMECLSDGGHAVGQAVQAPGVQTQTSVCHVAAEQNTAHQMHTRDIIIRPRDAEQHHTSSLLIDCLLSQRSPHASCCPLDTALINQSRTVGPAAGRGGPPTPEHKHAAG